MQIKNRPEYASKLKPLTCGPEESVTDACKAMSARNVGSIIVLDDAGKVLGLVTERDIFRRIIAEDRDPKTTAVSAVMTTELRTAKETDDVTDWLRIMSNERFRRLPVVDDSGRLVSVMSQGDFVSYTWPRLMESAKTLVASGATKNFQLLLVTGAILIYGVVSLILLARIL